MVTDLYLYIGLCQTNLETTFLTQNLKKGSVLHNIFVQMTVEKTHKGRRAGSQALGGYTDLTIGVHLKFIFVLKGLQELHTASVGNKNTLSYSPGIDALVCTSSRGMLDAVPVLL